MSIFGKKFIYNSKLAIPISNGGLLIALLWPGTVPPDGRFRKPLVTVYLEAILHYFSNLSFSSCSRIYWSIVLTHYTGCRIGEILGLIYDDFQEGLLSVNKQHAKDLAFDEDGILKSSFTMDTARIMSLRQIPVIYMILQMFVLLLTGITRRSALKKRTFAHTVIPLGQISAVRVFRSRRLPSCLDMTIFLRLRNIMWRFLPMKKLMRLRKKDKSLKSLKFQAYHV